MGRSIDPVDVANRLGAAMMRACEVLPAGWTLSVETERDAGTIRLSNPAGDDVEVSYDHDDFAHSVNAAIDQAIALDAGKEWE